MGLGGLVALGEPLHEVHLALVLPGLGALARAALAGEGHVPALVFGVLQRRVVVLQDDLREDAVLAFAVALHGTERGRGGQQTGFLAALVRVLVLVEGSKLIFHLSYRLELP